MQRKSNFTNMANKHITHVIFLLKESFVNCFYQLFSMQVRHSWRIFRVVFSVFRDHSSATMMLTADLGKNAHMYNFQMSILQRACFCVCVCYQRFQRIRVVWAAVSAAILTSHPASASVTLASPDASARVPVINTYILALGLIKLIYMFVFSYRQISLYQVSVFQYGAVCSVYTAVSKKKNALACVMLATVVLSVQVSAVCFSIVLLCVFKHLSNLHSLRHR